MPINKEIKVFGVIKRVLWDTMRVLSTKKKTNFIFSASSKAFSRMQIMDCIRKKFDPSDLEGKDKNHDNNDNNDNNNDDSNNENNI